MYASMTNGSYPFLKKIAQNHPFEFILFMQEGLNVLAYYESESKKSIFKSGRNYRLLHQLNNLSDSGTIVMDYLPIPDKYEKSFQAYVIENYKLSYLPGFLALRFLKPENEKFYIMLSQWESERYYKFFLETDEFTQLQKALKTWEPSYFADRGFTRLYHLIDEDK